MNTIPTTMHGIATRALPRLEVLRGLDFTSPKMQSAAYRVKSGVTIRSGQIISPSWNAEDSVFEWVLGIDLTAPDAYLAWDDSDDPDVVSAGALAGLSCSGQFEVQSAYFTGDSFSKGDYVVPIATGAVGAGSFEVVESLYTGGATAKPVVGRLTRVPNGSTGSAVDGVTDADTNTSLVWRTGIFFPLNTTEAAS